jgi:L-aminopeptidase/D-esterase-like protein
VSDAGSIIDVGGVRVGHWTDRRAATGCTVVIPDEPAVAGVDVRGGAPGTRETDLLRPGHLVERVHAIVVTGGSAYGLECASGVMRYLAERGVGYGFGKSVVPIVPAAVIFDLNVGANRWPDVAAGYRAAVSARRRCDEGSVGAGTGATVGKVLGPARAVKGGVGTAAEGAANGVVVGALCVVNAIGNIIDPANGRIVAGARYDDGTFADAVATLRSGTYWRPEDRQSTVIGVVATNAALTKEQANRLAAAAHDGLARAVNPTHTTGDGDVMFALATGAVPLPPGDVRIVEALAARAVERAIIRGVLQATGLAGVPAVGELPRPRARRSRR